MTNNLENFGVAVDSMEKGTRANTLKRGAEVLNLRKIFETRGIFVRETGEQH